MILKFNIDSSRPDGLSIIVRLILQKGKSSLKFFKFFIPFCHIFAFCQGHIYFQYKQHESEKKNYCFLVKSSKINNYPILFIGK